MAFSFGNLHTKETIPDYLKQVHIAQIDEFDNEWKPMMTRMMPRRDSPGLADGGSGREFTMPYGSDPQAMARYHDNRERVEVMGDPHLRENTFWCRSIKNAYVQDLDEFEGDFKNGTIQYKRMVRDRNLIRNIERTIEYTLVRYVFGDAVTMGSFSNQGTARQAIANIGAGNFNAAADANLGGQHWGINNADIFGDLNYLKDRFELMAGEVPEFLAIGRTTTRGMEDNNNLLARLINIKDTTNGVLAGSISQLQIVRVVGQTYKDVPGLAAAREGMPGQGDYLRQTWDRLNKVDMMSLQQGAQRWEWGLLASRNIGFTACAWTHKLHRAQRGSPTQFFTREFTVDDPLSVKNVAAITICPVVNDYAYAMRLDRTAPQ